MLNSRLLALALVPVLTLAACKDEDRVMSSATSQVEPAFGLATLDTERSEAYGFSWRDGLDDLDGDSEVLARGVWREPDGDIVTCTDWRGDHCIGTRESDDGLDMIEGLGFVAAGAAAGYGISKIKKPEAATHTPSTRPRSAATLAPASAPKASSARPRSAATLAPASAPKASSACSTKPKATSRSSGWSGRKSSTSTGKKR